LNDYHETSAMLNVAPRRRGGLIAWTSPRTTKLFHHPYDLMCLAHVRHVAGERCRFCSQPEATALTFGRLCNRLAGCLCAGHVAAACDLVERTQAVNAEAKRGEGATTIRL
jgi:hypothetical protein